MTDHIPKGWSNSTVGDACSIRNDLRFPISREERAGMSGDYPYYGPTGELGKIDHYRLDGEFALIGEDGDHFLDVQNKPQTLLVTGKLNVNNHAHVIESTEQCSAEWFYNYFRHRSLKPYLTRQGAGRYKLNKATLQSIPIVLPPLEEQATINRLFREWAIAIERTEQLVAAKEVAQRGLMQRLVMGRAHPEHRLSEFVNRVTRKNTTGNNHPLTISGRDGLISQSHYFDKRIAAETTEHYTRIQRGEFAYNKSYSAGYPYGAIKRLDACDEGIVSSLYLCFAIKSDAPLLCDYLVHFCEVGGFDHQIHKIAQEGARNHGLLNVAADDFFAMKLPLPPIDEQARVVAILGNAGRELALLRASLEQLRRQKRGLMQKLLTGQWRLRLSGMEASAP